MNSEQVKLLELFSSEINNSKRIEETWMLKKLISDKTLDLSDFKDFIFKTYNYEINSGTIQSCINNLNFEFITENHHGKKLPVREKYGLNIITQNSNKISFDYRITQHFKNDIFKSFLIDSIEHAIRKYENDLFESQYIDGFILYKKYTIKFTMIYQTYFILGLIWG